MIPGTLRSSMGLLFLYQILGEPFEIDLDATSEEAENFLSELQTAHENH